MFLKHPPDHPPRQIIQRRRGRDLPGSSEEKRRVQEPERGFGEHTREEVDQNWGGEADEPEPVEVCVEGAWGEDALGADEAPDDGGVEEDAAVGAGEAVGLVLGADVFDGVGEEGPAEDGDLDEAGPDGGDGLGEEHGARGDLHVLAEFEVLGEVEALGHGYVAVGFEEHHGEGFAGLDVAGHEFAGRGEG